MKWVLLVSVGPVQDFILTARKCQDLWYGSWLLSELARATASHLAEKLGDDALVFPAGVTGGAATGELPREVANKILVTLEGDAALVRALAESARSVMMARLRTERDAVFEAVGRGDPERSQHFLSQEARDQVDELIEFYWVATPFGDGDYASARSEAERLLAARKNTRNWAQPSWARPVPKSSLDGVRESVLHESVYGGRDGQGGVAPAQRLQWYGTDRAERLSGIDVLKRMGFDRLYRPLDQKGSARRSWHFKRGRCRFASTQHLAALPWMIQVDAAATMQPSIAAAWARYCDALDALAPGLLSRYAVAPLRDADWLFGDVDGTLLQENGLADAVAELVGGEALAPTQPRAEEARKAFLDAVRAATKRATPPELQPYYAILLADGDRMGAVIDHARQHSTHQAISAALAGFAEKVGEIVRERHGSLVYSGGDDVLALLPIHTALDCVATLHDVFGQAMEGFRDERNESPTLSAGLVFAHQKTPLFETLATVREAEKAAKAVKGAPGQPDKDALAFWVDKRSGERIEVTGRFAEVVDDLRQMTRLRRQGFIPGRAAYELDGLAALRIDPLPSEKPDDRRVRDAMTGVQADEILRVLGRRRTEGGTGAMPESVRGWLRQRAEALQDDNAAKALSLRLRAAEAIARGEDEAGVPIPAEAEATP
jgi:CRISPR-associated protein Cmr2